MIGSRLGGLLVLVDFNGEGAISRRTDASDNPDQAHLSDCCVFGCKESTDELV